MAPFPSTRVIHRDWAARHRPVARGAMTAECTVTTGGAAGWDPVTGPSTPGTPTTLHDGVCRIQALSTSTGERVAVGQRTVERPYLVGVEHTAPDLPVGARVKVTACDDDPHLVGKTLTVVVSQYGTQVWERDLLCDLDLTNQTGT